MITALGEGEEVSSHKIFAPDGYMIVGFCVKSGSENQNEGPELYEVNPGQLEVVLTHSSGKDLSHFSVIYEPIADEEVYWCSPGFWKTRGIEQGTLIGSPYDPTMYLDNPLPGFEPLTVGEALLMTGQYSNPAANYLSAHFFEDMAGTQETEGAFCPINAFGEWVGMED